MDFKLHGSSQAVTSANAMRYVNSFDMRMIARLVSCKTWGTCAIISGISSIGGYRGSITYKDQNTDHYRH